MTTNIVLPTDHDDSVTYGTTSDLATRVIRDTDLSVEQKGEILKIITQDQVSLTSEERAILDKNRWDLYEE